MVHVGSSLTSAGVRELSGFEEYWPRSLVPCLVLCCDKSTFQVTSVTYSNYCMKIQLCPTKKNAWTEESTLIPNYANGSFFSTLSLECAKALYTMALLVTDWGSLTHWPYEILWRSDLHLQCYHTSWLARVQSWLWNVPKKSPSIVSMWTSSVEWVIADPCTTTTRHLCGSNGNQKKNNCGESSSSVLV